MHPVWSALVASVFACAAGAGIIRGREPIAKAMRRAQVAIYGDAIRRLSESLTPRMVATMGGVVVLAGVFGVVTALLGVL